MHPFDSATRLKAPSGGDLHGRTDPAYANMVGPFGGVTAACLLRAPMLHADRLGDPIALTANFAAPLSDGEFTIAARPVRTNRSTQHWTVEMSQGGEVAATATAVFALRRKTWSATDASLPSPLPPAASLVRKPPIERLAWTHRYDMRFVRGNLPDELNGEEQADALSHAWVRDEPPRPLDHPALVSLCDSFFPRIFVRRQKAIPIGTVSMTTYFHADAAMLEAQAERHVFGAARALNYRDSYFDQTAEIWGDGGQLFATTHQIVYFRD